MFPVTAALGANILIAISKSAGHAVSGSAAMLDESTYSIVDYSNQTLLLSGDKQTNKGQSDLHQLDEGRVKYFFSTITAMILFLGRGALGMTEAFEKLTYPFHEAGNPVTVVATLLFGLAIEGSSLHVAMKEVKESNTENLSTICFLRRSRHSEILIIFMEGLCAAIGSVSALAGTVLTYATGIAASNAISGLMIGSLLMGAAIFLVKEFYSLIIGESATASDLPKIKSAFERPEISRLVDVKAIYLSPTEVLVVAKADIIGNREDETYSIINDTEKNIRQSLPDKKMYIYIETDKYGPSYSHR